MIYIPHIWPKSCPKRLLNPIRREYWIIDVLLSSQSATCSSQNVEILVNRNGCANQFFLLASCCCFHKLNFYASSSTYSVQVFLPSDSNILFLICHPCYLLCFSYLHRFQIWRRRGDFGRRCIYYYLLITALRNGRLNLLWQGFWCFVCELFMLLLLVIN